MGNAGVIKIAVFICLRLLTGEKSADMEMNFGMFEAELTAKSESEKLLDAFLADEIPAVDDKEESAFWASDRLGADESGYDYFVYSVGERMDLDNDGEDEQIINGPYGGIYLDARNGKVYVLAQGEGTAGQLFFTYYEDAVWIVHCDIACISGIFFT